jgi:hypothetical protein
LFTLIFYSDFEKEKTEKEQKKKKKEKKKKNESNYLMLLGRGPANPLILWGVRPAIGRSFFRSWDDSRECKCMTPAT